jgi:hypothetical protein
MIIWAFLEYDSNTKSIIFHIFEFVVNLIIVVDIMCKMKLTGFSHYFEYIENIIEFVIGGICVFLYLLYVFTRFSHSSILQNVEQPFVFVIWCVWQVFRIGYLVFKQHKARDTLDPKISFNQFHDEIDNNSFMGRPSAKGSDIGSVYKERIPPLTPVRIKRKTHNRVDPEVRMSLSYAE